MSTELLSNPAERRKAVRLKVRPDLHITEQRYEGKVYHVVKDPVCLRYYRFNRQEFHVFSLFDGQHTMEDVRKNFENEYRPHRLEFSDLENFARQLVTAGLVQHEVGGAGQHLYNRRKKQRRLKRFAAISNIMYWKIPVFDPDRILTWMYGYLWWIFTPTFFILSVGLMLAAVFQVLLHWQTFYDKMPRYQEFFAINTLLHMWLSLGVVKIIHEFGHGLSCKAYKGESHEMGILLMCFSPALYCNVTDAWTVADKWKRIIISFAGIYVELVIAAIATFVWWYTPHLPTVNNIAMAVMVMCSVSTFFFNANPLMRFDGYYILSDWLEIPNLRDRANKYLTNLFLHYGLGIETPPEQYMAPGRKVLFVVFAIASYVYRWVITFSIIFMLADLLPTQLKILSRMLAVFSLMTMFIWPAYRMVKNIRQRGRLPDMKSTRVYITLSLFAGFIAAVCLVPLPISRIIDHGLVQVNPSYSAPVALDIPAHLVSLHVKEGQQVRAGELIARFDSRELAERKALAEAERDMKLDEIKVLQQMLTTNLASFDPARLKVELAKAEGDAQKYTITAQTATEMLRRVNDLRSPRDGVVMGLVKREEVNKLFDRTYQQTQPVCIVGDPTKLRLLVPVSSVDHKLLTDDLPPNGELAVSIYVSGRTDQIFAGKITRLPKADTKQVPFALTSRGGGTVAVQQAGPDGREVVPVAQVYLVEVDLEDPTASIKPGALVKVKIHCQWRTAGWWLQRKFAELFDLGLYQ